MKIKTLSNQAITEFPADKIVIYSDGKKMLECTAHDFKEFKTEGEKIRDTYHGAPVLITLNNEIKRARKENLFRKDNYTLNYSGRYSWECGITLYIHVSEISVEYLGEFLALEVEGEKNYRAAYRLSFANPATVERCHVERVEDAGADFIPPEGCSWRDGFSRDAARPFYDIVNPSRFNGENAPFVVKRWIELENINNMIVCAPGYSRTEKSADREEREKIAAFINEKSIFPRTVSHYDINNLLKYFDIKIKKEYESEV